MTLGSTSHHVPTEDHALSASLGDLDALGCLYDRFHGQLYRFLVVRTGDVHLAEDLAHDTWIKVACAISGYQPRGGGFEAWLFTIGRRCVAQHYRRRNRHNEHLSGEMLGHDQADGDASPHDQLERSVQAHHIAAEVEALPKAQRQCVVYRFFVGLSLAETASVMGKTVGAIKQLQHRGLKALAKTLADCDEQEAFTAKVSLAEWFDADGAVRTGGRVE